MSLKTVMQLYADLDKLVQDTKLPGADASTIALFNANLTEAKAAFPNNPIIAAIQPASHPTLTRDLLVRVGQLKTALDEEDIRS